MAQPSWSLTAADGKLHILTGVDGRAAKMGHRLTLAMTSWQASVQWAGNDAASAELTVDVDSISVLSGEGGLTPLTGAEKGVCRSNALKSLDAKKFPRIRFTASQVAKTADGYRLDGTVEIHGTSRPQRVDLTVADTGDTLELSARVPVKQTDFAVKPFSLMMGALKVADEVTIAFSAKHAKS
jgi:polyisoprenoid-binding protein YceI